MSRFATVEDKRKLETEPWESVEVAKSMYEHITAAKERYGDRPALSFQILSDPGAKAETLTWGDVHGKSVQAANLFRSLGISEGDVVAYMLPNANETAIALIGAAIAGIVNPVNPLLDVGQVAGILRASNAKVLVTLKPFPKTNIAQKAAEAVSLAPNVKHVLEVDLGRYLTPPKSWLIPFVRPKMTVKSPASIQDFNKALDAQPSELAFQDIAKDRVVSMFHTGGTTGIPKLAQHRFSGIAYQGWSVSNVVSSEREVLLCPLPLFHAFAAYPIWLAGIACGSHMVLPTPSGYRGDGVFDNFWKLVQRWQATFIIGVPTAISALMQRPVDADISSLKKALCGSAPMPLELFNRFEVATGVSILEGYGMTEATCLVSVNPIDGERKVGSVGIPFPHTDVRVLRNSADGSVAGDCETGETGEICVANPGVYVGGTYTDPKRNEGLYVDDKWLRTGDLGKIDEDGYLWITGRAKDLIIRGGANVDPALTEEALATHGAVAFVGAVGQPDPRLGEVACAYVELVEGVSATSEELQQFAKDKIEARLAVPEHVEILPELPKTAVGKVFKPELRKLAIQRVFNEHLESEGLNAAVAEVVEEPGLGLVTRISRNGVSGEDEKVANVLGDYAVRWEWAT